MQHGHADGHSGEQQFRPLLYAFLLVFAYMFVELAVGIATNSLALISDAGHMGTDAIGLGIALAAIGAATRWTSKPSRTFGLYRLEILAALANALLLFAVAIYVVFESMTRFADPPEVLAVPMLVAAAIGLVVNVAAWRLLRAGASSSLNVEGAFLEVLADLVGSVGVLIAGTITLLTDWPYADPLFALGIGLFILPRAYRLARTATRILVQAAPENLDLVSLRDELRAIDGVIDVHDVHVWTLTSGMDVASMHVKTVDDVDHHRVLDQARDILRDRFEIAHATLQVEPESHDDCQSVNW